LKLLKAKSFIKPRSKRKMLNVQKTESPPLNPSIMGIQSTGVLIDPVGGYQFQQKRWTSF